MDQLLDRGHEAQRAGRMAEAEKLYLRALQGAEKLGDSSAKLANVLISVANVYHAKGDMEKAISLTERALAIDEKALGPEHWLVGRDLSNLAMLYQRQNPTAAEEYTRRVLELVETSPRLDNAHRLLFLRNAAGFYRYQGRTLKPRHC